MPGECARFSGREGGPTTWEIAECELAAKAAGRPMQPIDSIPDIPLWGVIKKTTSFEE